MSLSHDEPPRTTPYVFRLGVDSSVNAGVHIRATVGGGPTKRFLVDTGSVGLVVARQFVGPECTDGGADFEFSYSSSGNGYKGRWMTAVVRFTSWLPPQPRVPGAPTARRARGGAPDLDPDLVEAATAPMDIRVVDAVRRGREGAWITDSTQIHTLMLGVGFDIDAAGKLGGAHPVAPAANPFLMLPAMRAGALRPGYIIRLRGAAKSITLGLTDAVSTDFKTVQLVRRTPEEEGVFWRAPRIALAVPTAEIGPLTAMLLVDTGLNRAIVRTAANIRPPMRTVKDAHGNERTQVADGQVIEVSVPGLARPVYNFEVGTPRGEPEWVSWFPPAPGNGPFVNTSVHALSQFDYLFDDQKGRLGFRPHNVILGPSQSTSASDSRPPVVFPLGADSSVNDGIHLYASIGAGPMTYFTVDTGSTGIVIAKKYLGHNYTATGRPFYFGYSSSQIFYRGHWVIAPVTLCSSSDLNVPGTVSVDTVRMPVRMVEVVYLPGKPPITDPAEITTAMMGVGFDRNRTGEDDGQHKILPDINPFLRLPDMVHGSLARGFILSLQSSRKSITLGLADQNCSGFSFVQLDRLPPGPVDDWQAPTVDVSVPTSNIGPIQCTLLVDTGLSSAIVEAPAGLSPPMQKVKTQDGKYRTQVQDGQRIVISLSGATLPLYSFEVNAPRREPDWVTWSTIEEDRAPLINTSMHALDEFDYLFDHAIGLLGFRF